MRNLYGVISCCVLLSLAVALDNAHAKKPQKTAEVSAIYLDVLKIRACAAGQGCSTVGGPKQINLLEMAEGKTDFAKQVLLPARTHELRLLLGKNSTIAVDGQAYPLAVPSGQSSGLKLKGQKVFGKTGGFLADITLHFNLAKGLVVTAKKVKGKGKNAPDTMVYSYSLKPVIEVASAEIEPLPENMAAVVALPEKDVTLKFGSDFSMLIPAGAVSEPMVIKTEKTEEYSYAASPEGIFFNKPLVITLGYDVSLFTDAGYENPEESLSILMDDVGVISTIDTHSKILATNQLDLSVFKVGIANRQPASQSEDNYLSIQQKTSIELPIKLHNDQDLSFLSAVATNSSAIYEINDKYCSIMNIDTPLSKKELEESDAIKAIDDETLKKSFINMYIALSDSNKLEKGHEIHTCRSKSLAHRYSTASNIYNRHISSTDLENWTADHPFSIDSKNGNVKDEDGNVWYNIYIPRRADILCGRYIYDFDQCKKDAITDYIRRIAKKNAVDIASKPRNPFRESTIPGAEEGYGDEDKIKREPNIAMRISSHVTAKAVDLKLIDWDSFGGAWSDNAKSFVSKYGLDRPYQAGVTRPPNPEGVVGEEKWHFEESPLLATIDSISPNYATLGKTTTFTVNGQNLPSTLALEIDGCNNMVALGGTPTVSAVAATSMNFYSSSNTFTSRFFSCTPSSAGVKTCSVRDTQGGNLLCNQGEKLLCNFNVDFTEDAVTPEVNSVSPNTATLNEPITFTVTGQNLPSTLAFWISDCENVTSLGGSSTSMRFSCTPSYTTGEKNGVIKDAAGGTVLKEFTINVSGSGSGTEESFTCTSGSQTATWQGRVWQRCDDGKTYTWQEAIGYCNNLVLGGYSDWRLPTNDELRSLVVCTNGTPTPLAVYPDDPSVPYSCDSHNSAPYDRPTISSDFECKSEPYWSSSPYSKDTSYTLTVDFDYGWSSRENPATNHFYVRCVR